MGNIVVIVGRLNVGKLILFNCLIGECQVIIDDESGVICDCQYGISYWNGKNFMVIDIGGFVCNLDDVFEVVICLQVCIVIEEVNVFIFMVDVFIGLIDFDE